jgi:hypothetical protein
MNIKKYCHGIFHPQFFLQSTTFWSLIKWLIVIRLYLQIRRDIRQVSSVPTLSMTLRKSETRRSLTPNFILLLLNMVYDKQWIFCLIFPSKPVLPGTGNLFKCCVLLLYCCGIKSFWCTVFPQIWNVWIFACHVNCQYFLPFKNRQKISPSKLT